MTILEKSHSIQQQTQSMLCVGLDTDIDKLPVGITKDIDGIVEFNRLIIDATKDFCSAYKPNFAFYERYGAAGYAALERTRALIPDSHISIADAKRGDMGNTAERYARAILSQLDFDAVTVNPYQGFDGVEPFLAYDNKLVFVLALTSNPGSRDFQRLSIDGKPLYEYVMHRALEWKASAECGFVVGATHAAELSELRRSFPQTPFLIPGIGAQGADAAEIRLANQSGLAFVNSSRAILFASNGTDFVESARDAARRASVDLRP